MSQSIRKSPAQRARAATRASLAERLVRCLPAASFEMETLVSLTAILESRDVETAAVTCGDSPQLLLNPDFVASHCERDEHLFLLVMHELWHVILAHTRLYPRATRLENIAFDAIINAGLARQHPAPEYRGFFEALNSTDAFPARLLRPPEGWPRQPRYGGPGPRGTAAVLQQLYPSSEHPETEIPTQAEILALLERWQERRPDPPVQHAVLADPAECVPPDAPALLGNPAEGVPPDAPVLLGNHDDPDAETRALEDPVFGDVVRKMVAAWPPPPIPLAGRDAGRPARSWDSALERPGAATRRAFAAVLRRVVARCPGVVRRRERRLLPVSGGLAPLPNPADRSVHARQALGLPTLLRSQRILTPARVREAPACAHVYLDVSGSMFGVLPWLAGLVLPYVAAGRARVFQFSNAVQPISLDALRNGHFETTTGTDLDCVYAHWLRCPRVRRALVLTDGYVGSPRADLRRAARERGLQLHAVLPAEDAWQEDLAPLAASITVLPPL